MYPIFWNFFEREFLKFTFSFRLFEVFEVHVYFTDIFKLSICIFIFQIESL